MTSLTLRTLATALLVALTALAAPAQMAEDDALPAGQFDGAVAGALEQLAEDVRVYNDHVVTLANPYMGGRLPGTRGMEVAKDYVQYWLEQYGLQPAFAGVEHSEGNPWRQPFKLSSLPELDHHALSATESDLVLEPDVDFRGLAVGSGGAVTAPVVFVGYSISEGPDGFDSFGPHDDLSGKIAVMLRFEPMDADGKSLWSESLWSRHASFLAKLTAAREHGATAVVIINTPGADDPRVKELVGVRVAGSRAVIDGPVAMLSATAAAPFIDALGSGHSLDDLMQLANVGGGVTELHREAILDVGIKRQRFVAENVGGLLPGKGDLAHELVVVGAHLDHLGTGLFGSRGGAGELHPGADDNASGSAAVMMIGEKLVQAYAALPEGASARSIAFVLFSAEESGLNGARHYVESPIVPIEDHALMINFDMIGRIKDKKLSVSGGHTAAGMREWLDPIFNASPLVIHQPGTVGGASDHAAFMRAEVPVLFSILTDLHADYHTPADVSWKINREDAVHTLHMFREIALTAATLPNSFEYVPPAPRGNRATASAAAVVPSDSATSASSAPTSDTPNMANATVRFGIAPGSYDESEPGVLVGSVSDDTSASAAGIKAGDRLMTWNGKRIAGVMQWMSMLIGHDPGDVVDVGVIRDGEDIHIDVTLRAKGSQ